MRTSFFIMQLFQESVERSESCKLAITNALEELLFNCSAKVLKSDKDLLVFEQMRVFTDAFLSVINNDINQNHSDFNRECKTYERNIRKVFVSKEIEGRLEDLKNRETTCEISESLEQVDEEYSNIELARPRNIKEKSTPIVELKPYTNPLTR